MAPTRRRGADRLHQRRSTSARGLRSRYRQGGLDRRAPNRRTRTPWPGLDGRARAQITMSVGVRIDVVATAAWGWLSLATGLAVIDAVTPLIAAGGLKHA
ncbi:putative biotin--[acetyl-CoA-carboxylase] ligase [Mycobacterium kansasii]|uniref:Putative biotin--[acetyl-CoA-carboxylase] ligase n=1 Tax=Mycobacterium kansasii TaxID=1768 RepID=A0A1V3WBX5_MYCKA|nr:putative biotin--[acetyl-CoA-carboxylase] ligase [Mycobacterium kansasii]